MIKVDARITLALVVALFLETIGGFIWVGRASARLDDVESAVATQAEIADRLARVEVQLIEARRVLERIENRLERE